MMKNIIKTIPTYALLLAFALTSNGVFARPDVHQEFPTYIAPSNGISIAYQEFGNPANETVLLVMGLGAQLIHWDDSFVMRLVDAGYHVVRFDNRDIGFSEKLHTEPEPGLITMLRYQLGWSLNAPYDLSDMAADGIGLLDYLGVQQAHVVGASMGGMIAQIMASEYPDRVLSLGSIMSTSGDPDLPEGPHQVEMRDRSELSREEAIAQSAVVLQAIDARENSRSQQEWLATAARSYDRSHYDPGFGRQVWAVLESGDRVELLKALDVPTVVIHGALDPLLPLEHGQHTAELVKGSTWVVLEDMGHYLGEEHHDRLVAALVDNFKRVGQ